MAVVKIPQNSRVQLKVQTGISASGAPVYVTRSFNNIKASATDDSVFAVGLQLSGLQKHTLTGIEKIETASLVQE